jgi:hypothetical protein
MERLHSGSGEKRQTIVVLQRATDQDEERGTRLVRGGVGIVGSHFIRGWLTETLRISPIVICRRYGITLVRLRHFGPRQHCDHWKIEVLASACQSQLTAIDTHDGSQTNSLTLTWTGSNPFVVPRMSCRPLTWVDRPASVATLPSLLCP